MLSIFHRPTFNNDEKNRSAGIMFGVLWTVILAVTVLEISNSLTVPAHLSRWITIVVIVDGFCLVLLYLNRIGYTKHSAVLLNLLFWALAVGLVISGNGLSDPTVPSFLIIIALSGITLGRRAILVTSIGFALTAAAISWLEYAGLAAKDPIQYRTETLLVIYIIYTIIIATVQYIDFNTIKDVLREKDTQNEDRKRTESALQVSVDFINNLLQTVDLMVIGLDLNGNVTLFNRAAETISGYNSDEIKNKKHLASIFSQNNKTLFQPPRPKISTWQSEGFVLTKTGQNKYIVWQSTGIFDQGQLVGYIHTGMDLSEAKQHERSLETMAIVSSALRKTQTRVEIFKTVLKQLESLFSSDYVALVTLDQKNEKYHFEAHNDETFRLFLAELFSPENQFDFIENDSTYIDNHFQDNRVLANFIAFKNIKTFAFIPLLTTEKKIGYLILLRKEPIVSVETGALEAIAEMTAGAIQRTSIHEKSRGDIQRLAALHQIDLALSGSFDTELIIDTLLDQVVNQLHARASDILLLDPSTQILRLAASKGLDESKIKNKNQQVGKCLAGTAVTVKSIIYIADLSTSGGWPEIRSMLNVNQKISYYAVPLIIKDTILGALEVYLEQTITPDRKWLEFLEMLTGHAAIAIDDAELFRNLQKSNLELTEAYEATIGGWSHALDLRDKETEGHTQRVTELTVKLARFLNVDETEIDHIRRGALLHDIGKMGIPDSILLKPGPLTPDEWIIMKKHPMLAFEMLSPIHYLKKAIEIPYCHHEKWNGSGYPRQLKGEDIPQSARIFAVVDVWDAVTSDRPYRAAWDAVKAMTYILSESGSHFEPKVVDAFVKMMWGKG